MGANLKLVVISGFIGLAIYWLYRVLDWVWFRPKKLEKCLRDQGFKGNPYTLLVGDQYWSAKMIKEAKTKPIGIDDDVKKRIMPHIVKTVETYGKNSFMWIGRIPRVNCADPELAREVLTKYYIFQKNHHDFDPITKLLLTGIGSLEKDAWVDRRKILNAAFHFEKIKLMLPSFYTSCCNLVSKWEGRIPDGGSTEIEVWQDLQALTGDGIAKTLFSSNYEEGRRIFQLLKELTYLTIETIQSVYIPGNRFLPTKRNRRMKAINKEVRERVITIINRKMKAMKAGEASGDDFLGILLELNMKEIEEQGNNQNAGLTIDDIISECKQFSFAGGDTTATFILWTMILLSRHPEWQARAREEVLQVFGDKKPEYDGISRLKTMSMIMWESLRLYTPIVELTKVPHDDTQLGKYFIPAGVQLMIPLILLHQDPDFWGDDVLEFKPERFLEGSLRATNIPGSYIPFSFGPRMCIGQNFALLEGKMALALILRHFSFELSPSYAHAPFTLLTMHPQYGAPLILRKRL